MNRAQAAGLGFGNRGFRVALLVLAMAAAACGGGGGDSATVTPPGQPPTTDGVSGIAAQGNTLTVTGSGFGAKSLPGPMLYDDFDDASVTNINGREPQIHQGNLAFYNSWQRTAVGSGAPQIVRDNSSTLPFSNYHARMDFSGSWTSLYLTVTPVNYFTTGQEMYISFWYRFTKTSAGFGRQTKAWIVYPPTGTDKAYFSTAFDTCESGGWRLHRSEGGFIDENFGVTGPEVDSEWIRIESYLKQSTPGLADGAWAQAMYRTATPNRVTDSLGIAQMRTSSADWTFWGFGGTYFDPCPAPLGGETATIDLDEFYMDNTPARVEVCDAATFATSNRCELQVASAWSDTSITFKFNRGFLATGPAYVYVFNTSGLPNANGYRIDIP